MNPDAEEWIAHVCAGTSLRDLTHAELLRWAMEWAYADAAKTCRALDGKCPIDDRSFAECFANAIEDRAK